MIYQAGDTVLYGTQGVCRIEEVSEKNYNGTPTLYYVLKPISDERSTVYVPVHNKASAGRLRSILSVSEVYELIKSMPDENTIWIENESLRREKYKAIISRGDRRELVKLIKTIYLHNQERKSKGKKTHITDERFMKDAEKILYDEFAHVLKISPEQVVPFVTEQIEIGEKQRIVRDL